jgi:hypothetical protein
MGESSFGRADVDSYLALKPCAFGHVRVYVDGRDLPGRAGKLRHQRRVVTTGVDLQNTACLTYRSVRG